MAAARIRQRATEVLSQIIGLPLAASHRGADMRVFHFGKLRPVNRGAVGDFALHVQCPWRIDGPDGIVTGRMDLWEPVEDNRRFDDNTWDYEKSPNLQDFRMDQWLSHNGSWLVVKSVDADECGGAVICFEPGFVLRLFPAGIRGEDWRFFRPTSPTRHFVVTGGSIETDGGTAAKTE